MSKFLLAGGGTGGHVNPMLALAQQLILEGHQVVAVGTKEGLEARLVPERGIELITVPKLPFPRKLSLRALSFPFRLMAAGLKLARIIRTQGFEAVVGFGGYASAPAYLAGFLARVPVVIHEANALSGMANRLAAKFTKWVAVAFPNSNLSGAITGMPIRQEILDSIWGYDKGQARVELGLDPMLPTLLVTGGSLGARSLNQAVIDSLPTLKAAGIQVLHIVGEAAQLPDLQGEGYRRMAYCDRMDAAIAASDFAISRAGASTVAEFSAAGLPAVYIPYPVGNGEQRFNAVTVCDAGGGLLVADADFSSDYIQSNVIPLISHAGTLSKMSEAARSQGIPDSTLRLRDLVLSAVNT
jgi:UDP-N-acetylglucosamine--N-acetylmuramyl-(pentapeptide) pyrophosphoryl-undecaprenol N-acetylglucosamine transferase